VYACTHPELEGKSGSYLYDCHVATPYASALKEDNVKQLWVKTEELIKAAKY